MLSPALAGIVKLRSPAGFCLTVSAMICPVSKSLLTLSLASQTCPALLSPRAKPEQSQSQSKARMSFNSSQQKAIITIASNIKKLMRDSFLLYVDNIMFYFLHILHKIKQRKGMPELLKTQGYFGQNDLVCICIYPLRFNASLWGSTSL